VSSDGISRCGLVEGHDGEHGWLLPLKSPATPVRSEPPTPDTRTVATRLNDEIAAALNRACAEKESNTPDFILATYLLKSLEAFDLAVRQRERWYGRSPNDGPPSGLRAEQAALCQEQDR
jgi:hypothetical protein